MIPDSGYSALKAHLIAFTGLSYYSDRDPDFAERIGRRLSELGLPHCAAYSALLADAEAGPRELDVIVARLNIGETYFFRDQKQWDAIRDVILPEILIRNRCSRRLSIWSAGCSNGAEPYSLAILLERQLKDRLAGWQVSILATDISQPSLVEAAEGRYGEWALRSTPDEVRQQCFSRDTWSWTIRPEHKRRISFVKLNLADDGISSSWSELGKFDLILCRNVMIYFAADLRRHLIRRFRESLSAGGWLLVGAVEHDLENFKSFGAVLAPGATLYQNLEPPDACPLDTDPRPLGDPRHPEVSSCLRPANSTPFSAGRSTDRTAPPHIQGLRELADRGDWERAVPYCRQLLALDCLNPAVHFYHALLLEQLRTPAEAERSLRQAIYLDRHFLLAHYHLGLTLTKDRKRRPAMRSFENVLNLLSDLHDDQTVVDGDGVTVAGLKELAKMHLHNLGAL